MPLELDTYAAQIDWYSSFQAELRGLESQRADSQNQLAALAKKIDTMRGMSTYIEEANDINGLFSKS